MFESRSRQAIVTTGHPGDHLHRDRRGSTRGGTACPRQAWSSARGRGPSSGGNSLLGGPPRTVLRSAGATAPAIAELNVFAATIAEHSTRPPRLVQPARSRRRSLVRVRTFDPATVPRSSRRRRARPRPGRCRRRAHQRRGLAAVRPGPPAAIAGLDRRHRDRRARRPPPRYVGARPRPSRCLDQVDVGGAPADERA